MKKITTAIISIGFLFLLSMLSCNKKKMEQKANAVIFDTISIVKLHYLQNDSSLPHCLFKLSYIYPADSLKRSMLGAAQAEMNYAFFQEEKYEFMFPEEAIREYILDYIKNFEEESKVHGYDKNIDQDYYNYRQILEGRIIYNQDSLLSYQVKTTNTKAGLNYISYNNIVFDLKNGERIREENIFEGEYRTIISKLVQNKLLHRYNESELDALLKLGFYDLRDLSPNNNFTLNERELSYLFNAGSIAISSHGEIIIDLSYDELSSILIKENNPIATLINKK